MRDEKQPILQLNEATFGCYEGLPANQASGIWHWRWNGRETGVRGLMKRQSAQQLRSTLKGRH